VPTTPLAAGSKPSCAPGALPADGLTTGKGAAERAGVLPVDGSPAPPEAPGVPVGAFETATWGDKEARTTNSRSITGGVSGHPAMTQVTAKPIAPTANAGKAATKGVRGTAAS
jgi:hypothetical protein